MAAAFDPNFVPYYFDGRGGKVVENHLSVGMRVRVCRLPGKRGKMVNVARFARGRFVKGKTSGKDGWIDTVATGELLVGVQQQIMELTGRGDYGPAGMYAWVPYVFVQPDEGGGCWAVWVGQTQRSTDNEKLDPLFQTPDGPLATGDYFLLITEEPLKEISLGQVQDAYEATAVADQEARKERNEKAKAKAADQLFKVPVEVEADDVEMTEEQWQQRREERAKREAALLERQEALVSGRRELTPEERMQRGIQLKRQVAEAGRTVATFGLRKAAADLGVSETDLKAAIEKGEVTIEKPKKKDKKK